MTLNSISIATERYVCANAPDPIAIGTHGYVCEGVAKKKRGGKGTPYDRRKHLQKQRTVFVYTADASFENSIIIDGTTVVNFIPFVEPIFVEPPVIEPVVIEPTTFYYDTDTDGGLAIDGEASEEYYDYRKFILAHDDEAIIVDLLSTFLVKPFIVTTYDSDLEKYQELEKRRKDDQEILNLLQIS